MILLKKSFGVTLGSGVVEGERWMCSERARDAIRVNSSCQGWWCLGGCVRETQKLVQCCFGCSQEVSCCVGCEYFWE